MNKLEFLEKYENAKKEIRKRIEYIDFINCVKENKAIKFLREIEIIQKAFSKACGSYII